MTSILELPVEGAVSTPEFPPASAESPVFHGLPRVERVRRQGPVLHASPLAPQADVLSLNITRGCGMRCTFCSVRASQGYSGDDVLYLFEDTADRLRAELRSRRKRPRAVYLCPSGDPFAPFNEVQAETMRVVKVLAEYDVESWLMTRGFARPKTVKALAAHAPLVKVTYGLTTLNRALQRSLEPLTAPPRLRLKQIAQLRQLGIGVQVALEPLLPGITDTRENLLPLLQALAKLGIGQVSTSYLFLRENIRDQLLRALPDGVGEAVVEEFNGGPVMTSGTIAGARYLPKVRRQRGYAAIMALASELGMRVSVTGTTNPDFQSTARPAPEQKQPMPLLAMFLARHASEAGKMN